MYNKTYESRISRSAEQTTTESGLSAGIVIGLVALFVAIVGAIGFWKRNALRKEETAKEETNDQNDEQI